ncbi:MAG: aldehyde ferredoxin oxidoreductase family protein [Deltaproteobacteria bacterium]|nr:aldehyde ferredoxin oxidoreductase family protein [Deltaproteobacteria bacterium]MBW2419668.1 aldehyde ferredoxin oxidoreductase family protein [Deltaproteobacteria bacterium]
MKLDEFGSHIAHIDLSRRSVELRAAPKEWVRKYVGGRGLGVRYVFERGADVDPLSPENLLCFMNGPLSGSEVNMSGRWAAVTKSPLTGTITDSHQGGWSAARLRWAGLDGLVFDGRSEQPVYAYVEDGAVSLRDASEVWGKNVHETVDFFRERYGARHLSVCTIGVAGEKQVLYSAWINEDDRAFGRGGTGAVGGSKKLKAIVIKAGPQKSQVPDTEAWREARRVALAAIRDESTVTSPKKGGLSVYGTNVLMNIVNSIGALGTRNSQETTFGERAERISGEYVQEKILVNDPTCHACPVACKKEVEITEGPHAGLRMESVEYEPAWSLGANCGNDDIASIAKMIDQCNDYGLDPIELGGVFSAFMEASQKGYLNGKEEGSLEWGDHGQMIALIEQIALRKGMGDVLAEGTARTAAHFGHSEIAMVAKGQAVAAYEPRGMKGMGLGYATSNRGGCHLRGYVAAAELGVLPIKADPLEWKGKGALLKLFQDLAAFSDSLDLCKFSAFAEGADEYAQQYAAALGIECSADDVLEIGERVYNLERHYNNLAGFGPGSDTLPERYTREPSTAPGSKGHVCELELMLEEYYEARGWEDGVVPDEKLEELALL